MPSVKGRCVGGSVWGEGQSSRPSLLGGRDSFYGYRACLPFPFNNSLAKLLPHLKFGGEEGVEAGKWDDGENPALGGWAGAPQSSNSENNFW